MRSKNDLTLLTPEEFHRLDLSGSSFLPKFCYADQIIEGGANKVPKAECIMLDPVEVKLPDQEKIVIMNRSQAILLEYEVIQDATYRKNQIQNWLQQKTHFLGRHTMNMLFVEPKRSGESTLIEKFFPSTDTQFAADVRGKTKVEDGEEDKNVFEKNNDTDKPKYKLARITPGNAGGGSLKQEGLIDIYAYEYSEKVKRDYRKLDAVIFVFDKTKEIDDETVNLYHKVEAQLPKDCLINFVIIESNELTSEKKNQLPENIIQKLKIEGRVPAPKFFTAQNEMRNLLLSFLMNSKFAKMRAQIDAQQKEQRHLKADIKSYLQKRINAIQPYWFTLAWRAIKNSIVRVFTGKETKQVEPKKLIKFRNYMKRLDEKEDKMLKDDLIAMLIEIEGTAGEHRSQTGIKSWVTSLHQPASLSDFKKKFLAYNAQPIDNTDDKQADQDNDVDPKISQGSSSNT